VKFTEETLLDTKYGILNVRFFKGAKDHYCLCIYKKPWGDKPFVRIHSACLFSESLGAIDCDCSRQLDSSLKEVSESGGVIVYMFQEGRGLGLEGKIKAMELQRIHSIDTAEAFKRIGEIADLRDYTMAFNALKALGVPSEISLATNNPERIRAAKEAGFIVHRVKLSFKSNDKIRQYLRMKKESLNHFDHE
jgi:3,4-dihydroxy 2-butanone 4-phosphate synthase/GTP cyclohydrolase II